MTTHSIIHQHIKPRMQERGLTNYALAKITGINRSTIGRYLEGNLNISLDNFLIIIKSLELNISLCKHHSDSKPQS